MSDCGHLDPGWLPEEARRAPELGHAVAPGPAVPASDERVEGRQDDVADRNNRRKRWRNCGRVCGARCCGPAKRATTRRAGRGTSTRARGRPWWSWPRTRRTFSLAVRFAREEGLGVGVMATGHGVGTPADGGLLVNTSLMRGVRVDPATRTARVEAGALWKDVIPEAHATASPAWLVRPPTSASSATRWAAASGGSDAGTASTPRASPRPTSLPQTASSCA